MHTSKDELVPTFEPGDRVSLDSETFQDLQDYCPFKPLFREGTVQRRPHMPLTQVIVGIKAVPVEDPAARPQVQSFLVPAKSLTRVPDPEPTPPTF